MKSALSVDLEPRQKEVREWMWFPGMCAESRALPSPELSTPAVLPGVRSPSMAALDFALEAPRAH